MNSPELYRCIISPGIVEIRSNVKFILGFFTPFNFKSEQAFQLEPSSEICITCSVQDDIPNHYLSEAIELGEARGQLKGNILQNRRSFLSLVKPHLELKGLHSNPIVTVNKFHYKLVRVKIGDWYPLGVCIQDLLLTQLLIQGYGAIHGAAFGVSGTGVLVVGLPGVGKSTVLFEALKQGYQFLTEDMIIVDSDGYLHSCPGVSSFSIEMKGILKSRRCDKLGSLRSWWMNLLSRAPFAFSLLKWPYVDILSFFPQVERITRARPHSLFILAKGNRHIEKLSPAEALRILVSLNRHTFSYHENRLLLKYSLLNPWFNLSELMQTEERLLQELVNSSRNFLCVAHRPEDFFGLIQQNI